MEDLRSGFSKSSADADKTSKDDEWRERARRATSF
jgi:hypothetical protein